MTQVAITGGAGLVGSNLITQLSSKEGRIRVIDNFTSGHSSNIRNVHGWLDVRMGDICQTEMLLEAFKDVDIVYHLAAQTDPFTAWAQPASTSKVNVDGTLSVIRACAVNKVKRLVFASCGCVYGGGEAKPRNEETPVNPLGPLGISKIAAESYCRTWGKRNDFEVVCLRLFEVYGPNNHTSLNDNRIIPNLVQSVVLRKPATIRGADCIHDFVFADDAAKAILLAGELDGIAGRVINIGSGVGTKVESVVGILEELSGNTSKRDFVDSEQDVPEYNVSDNALAKELLGWEPTTSLEKGLKLTWEATR